MFGRSNELEKRECKTRWSGTAVVVTKWEILKTWITVISKGKGTTFCPIPKADFPSSTYPLRAGHVLERQDIRTVWIKKGIS